MPWERTARMRAGASEASLLRRQARFAQLRRVVTVFAVVGFVWRYGFLSSFGPKTDGDKLSGSGDSATSASSDTTFAALKHVLGDTAHLCALYGNTCRCTGTVIYSNLFGDAIRETNVEGELLCNADAFGAPMSPTPRMCWCRDGVSWGDDVRKGLAAMIQDGLMPRIEIAGEESPTPGCDSSSDGSWHGCVVQHRRWDSTFMPHTVFRTAPLEEQYDMILRQLDNCHHMKPRASLRVLGVKNEVAVNRLEMPVSKASSCSVVFRPDTGATWTGKLKPQHCSSKPGKCTTTPCECRNSGDNKLTLLTPEGRTCYACAAPDNEYQFQVNALAEELKGGSVSWWPPYGINCPPILWMFMDWRQVFLECPVLCGYMVLFFIFLGVRRAEEFSSGLIPWTRVAPLFGPALKKGEIWRFITYTFFHIQFLEIFFSLLTLVDTLDVEGTPKIILGDGSNLKCGVGTIENYMCYPSIGIGSSHTLGVALLSAAAAGMASTWLSFRGVVTGAASLGFGLSGAIVSLYALYSGANLDQFTKVQRSFQDWVSLRLIFVGVHLFMECVRGLSQGDFAGFASHIMAFGTGFGYVLYFLPPMGDGTLLPANQPYIVPCAYDSSGGLVAESSNAPQCIRLFSMSHEYPVAFVQQCLLTLACVTVGFTALNILRLQRRVSSTEATIVAGMEVSAICCVRRSRTPRPRDLPRRNTHLDGHEQFMWCDVFGVSNLAAPVAGQSCRPFVEIRIVPEEQASDLDLLEGGEASRTRPLDAGKSMTWRESLFLRMRFSETSVVQIALKDSAAVSGSDPQILGVVTLPLSQALRFYRKDFNEVTLRLTPQNNGQRTCTRRSMVRLVFRTLEIKELAHLRRRVRKELEDRKFELDYREFEMTELRQHFRVQPGELEDVEG